MFSTHCETFTGDTERDWEVFLSPVLAQTNFFRPVSASPSCCEGECGGPDAYLGISSASPSSRGCGTPSSAPRGWPLVPAVRQLCFWKYAEPTGVSVVSRGPSPPHQPPHTDSEMKHTGSRLLLLPGKERHTGMSQASDFFLKSSWMHSKDVSRNI